MLMSRIQPISRYLVPAVQARLPLISKPYTSALRLFNGFTEGIPGLSVDLYGKTLVLHNYGKPPSRFEGECIEAAAVVNSMLPGIEATVQKARYAKDPAVRNGLTKGKPDKLIEENGVLYSINLTLNQDAGFYLDTRLLRRWIHDNAEGLDVLNTFAYTGSLGIAALAGGATRVVHVDIKDRFLEMARASTLLNGFHPQPDDFLCMDFFTAAGRLKQRPERFDIVILDPPFFSKTRKAAFDMNRDTPRLINKVRPLVKDQGLLIVVNNALFLPGKKLIDSIRALCSSGYLEILELLPVPGDMCGFNITSAMPFPADPAPFIHPTKIIILRVRHRSQ